MIEAVFTRAERAFEPLAPRQFQMAIDPDQDLHGTEGLVQEVHSAESKALEHFSFLQGAQENHRDGAEPLIPLKAAADLEAIHRRHPDIQQNQVERVRGSGGERRLPSTGGTDSITFVRENPA